MSIETIVKYAVCDINETKFLTDPVTKAFSKYRENAYEWDNEKSAQYIVEQMKKTSQPCKVIKSYTYSADIDECLMMDVKAIEAFLDIVKESKSTVTTLEQRLDTLNRELTDIEHYIQFKDLNVPGGYKIYKKLQSKRRERAYVKGKLRIARDVNSLKIDENTLESLVRLFKQELTYRPREINFEDMI